MKLSRMGESESEELIYFQNLIPGKSDSPFIEQYKKECLDENDADYEARKALVEEFPPILSFTAKQKKKFYEEQAQNCSFCCGSMTHAGQLMGGDTLQQADNYMYSNGSGKLYEGSAAQIRSQLQEDVRQEQFGSTEQNQRIAEMNQFDASVNQRTGNKAPAMVNEVAQKQTGSPNPFKTDLKPFQDKD